MYLPSSFNVFIRHPGARPYQETPAIAGFSNDLAFSSAFGLGGVYVKDTNELHITIGQRTGGVDFTTLASGTVGVYRSILDSSTDYLIREVQLTVDLLKKPRNAPWYWELVVKTDIDPSELMLGCVLVPVTGSDITTWTAVESEERTKQVNYYSERFRTSLDVNDEAQPQPRVFIEPVDSTCDYITLDFAKQDDPVVVKDSGMLAYQGGGNRYLIDFDGESVLQQVNQAPWSLPAHLFIEHSSWNYFTDSKQALDKHRINTSASMITTKKTDTWLEYPGYLIKSFAVSSPSVVDSTWEYETEQVPVVNQTLTGSLFMSCTNQSNRKFPIVLGLRYRSVLNGVVLRETTNPPVTTQIKDLTLMSCVDPVQTPSSVVSYVSMFVQVQQLSPGDRFVLETAAPQLENSAFASSRIPSTLQRLSDTVTFQPTNTAYDVPYGVFKLTCFPAYSGIPGQALGDQYFFDTRDGSGEAGFHACHTAEGLIKFVLVGDTVTDTWVCESASVMQLVYGTQFALEFWFDTNQMTLKLNNKVIGTKTFQASFAAQVPDQVFLRIGHDMTETKFFNGEVTYFALETTPLVVPD